MSVSTYSPTASAARPDPGDRPDGGGAARLFNSVVAGFAVAAAWETGALDELDRAGVLAVDAFCAREDLHRPAFTAVVAALAAVDVVRRDRVDGGSDGEVVRPGPEFAEVYRDKAFFHWLTAGCGELLARMPAVTRNAGRVGDFSRRDGAAIARSCREINRHAFDPAFHAMLDRLPRDLTRVADLGCGSGERLVQLAAHWPDARGVGVDISSAALDQAERHLTGEGLADRFELVRGDVRAMSFDERFRGVQLLTCFMMGHDFWPRDACLASLRRLRAAFPDVHRLLLGDTARTQGVPDREKPVFTLGFETVHDLMGVYLPTIEEWVDLFAASDWTLVQVHPVAVPRASVVFELA